MNMEPSGDIVSGYVIAFSSEQELSKDDFADYVERYVAKDFAGMEITVSRYTIMFESVDSYFYRPDHIPLQLSMYLSKEEVLGKNFIAGMNEISNPVSDPSDLCFLYCQRIQSGEICAGPLSPIGMPNNEVNCGPRFRTFCSNFCFPSGGGYGGGSNGGGGGNSNEDEDEDECECAHQYQCDIADEYGSGNNHLSSCSSFTNNHGIFVVSGRGTENGKHGSYGYVDDDVKSLYGEVSSYLAERKIYNTLNINSGWRCPNGNSKVSDAYESAHKYGRAADVQIYDDYDNGVWTDKLKNDVVEFNERVRPGSYSYAKKRDPIKQKTGHVHISNMPAR